MLRFTVSKALDKSRKAAIVGLLIVKLRCMDLLNIAIASFVLFFRKPNCLSLISLFLTAKSYSLVNNYFSNIFAKFDIKAIGR